MITQLLEKTMTCVHQSLQDARLGPSDLDKVMLVGGSTRTPRVQELLRARLDLEPRWEISPDLIVAMGAAIQGAVIAGEKQEAVLVDITAHTFATGALTFSFGYEALICVPIIHRNTPLPASKAEIFTTVGDGQRQVLVSAYQGESLVPEENLHLGEFKVEGLSDVPAGNPVIIHFDLDLNGMLKVTATEKITGLAKSVVLDTRKARVLDLDEARRNIAALVERGRAEETESSGGDDPLSSPGLARLSVPESDQEEPTSGESDRALIITAKDLRKRGETLLGKNISPEDAAEIQRTIHASAEAIHARDWVKLGEQNEAFSDLLFYLED